jgi:hypothetical protein
LRRALVVLVACGKSQPPPEVSCEDAVATAMRMSTFPDAPDVDRDAVREMAIAHCKGDPWPPDTRQCIATTQDELTSCLWDATLLSRWETDFMPLARQANYVDKPGIDTGAIIREAFARVPSDDVLHAISLASVRSDGTLHHVFGRVDLTLGDKLPPDDPRRPTGAPVVAPRRRTRCPILNYHHGAWHDESEHLESNGGGRYSTMIGRICADAAPQLAAPRCTTAQVWARAKAAGAPDGVATLTLDPTGWRFTIDDATREVHVAQTIPDDCAP